MSEKIKLVELLEATGMVESKSRCEIIAEELICNGVIVPPCPIGSKIYMIVTKRSKICMPPFSFIKVSKLTYCNLERVLQDFGKTVFLTKQEAEKALAERSE